MNATDIIGILKLDLQISTPHYDGYLQNLIMLAKKDIEKEGIVLDDSTEDGMLVEMYAAYLYRKRREGSAVMPRSLRYMLNNRLMSQKAGNANG